VQILLNRPFRQVELVRDFLVKLRLYHEIDDLLLSKREMPGQRFPFGWLRLAAGRADPILAVNGKLISAAAAVFKNSIQCKFQVGSP
jgi:hypothetical protein